MIVILNTLRKPVALSNFSTASEKGIGNVYAQSRVGNPFTHSACWDIVNGHLSHTSHTCVFSLVLPVHLFFTYPSMNCVNAYTYSQSVTSQDTHDVLVVFPSQLLMYSSMSQLSHATQSLKKSVRSDSRIKTRKHGKDRT